MASSETGDDPETPNVFPQFAKLPQELQLMVWEAVVNPRGLYLASCATSGLPRAPAMSEACRVSRKVYLQQRHSVFVIGQCFSGRCLSDQLRYYYCWFDPKRDIFLCSDRSTKRLLDDPLIRNLESITIWDRRYSNYEDKTAHWMGISDENTLGQFPLGKYDAMEICEWYEALLNGDCPLHTINIYRAHIAHWELWLRSSKKMNVGKSTAVKKLFGDDAVYMVNLQDEIEVNKVCSILSSEDSAKPAAKALESIHQDIRRNEYLYCSELLEHFKFLWLDTTYKWNKERGLPARRVEQKYYWHEERRVFVCDEKNWSEDDPEIQSILQRMPQIRSVYILVSV